jgi:hypothetical protein
MVIFSPAFSILYLFLSFCQYTIKILRIEQGFFLELIINGYKNSKRRFIMAVQRISLTAPTFKAQPPKPSEEPEPQAKCDTCQRFIGKRCDYFQRPTQGNFNRCWCHSFYKPNITQYYISPSQEQLNRWIEESEKADKDREKKVKLPC